MAGLFKRAFWTSDGGTILYCDATGMYTVRPDGGGHSQIVRHPHIEHPSLIDLPGGRRAVLFQALDAEQPGHAIYIRVLGETQRRLVTLSESTNPYPAWSPTGHIIYVDGPNYKPSIWALPLSLETLRATGKAFQIVESGSAPMLSATGTMVYGDPPPNRLQLSRVDRAGKPLAILGEPKVQSYPLLSPDGRRVVVAQREPRSDLVVHDLERGGATPITSDDRTETPGSWIPGGELLYLMTTAKERAIVSNAPGGRDVTTWLTGRVRDPRWSPDGRYLLYTELDEENRWDGSGGEMGSWGRRPSSSGPRRTKATLRSRRTACRPTVGSRRAGGATAGSCITLRGRR